MNSRFYRADVTHFRHGPSTHSFSYPVFYYGFDLTELDRLDATLPGFGYNRKAIVSLFDQDFLAPDSRPVLEKLSERWPTLRLTPEMRVLLVAMPRLFLRSFNPAVFYFVLNRDGTLHQAGVDVTNTYGDAHFYAVPIRFDDRNRKVGTKKKAFHVSPFFTVDGRYRFRFGCTPLERLDVEITLFQKNRPALTASLAGRGSPLEGAGHLLALSRAPMRFLMTLPRIFKEAAHLRFKHHLPFHDRPIPTHPLTRTRKEGPMESWYQSRFHRLFEKTRHGNLQIRYPDGEERRYGSAMGDTAELAIKDPAFFTACILGGDIGFGDAYVGGLWESPDPVKVVRFLIRNRDVFSDGALPTALVSRFRDILRTRSRHNSQKNSQENISRHYDQTLPFFERFLDDSLTYSCARFGSLDETLEKAQARKRNGIIDRLQLKPRHHVLEIGCGFGSLAIDMAKTNHCTVTAVTLSKVQYDETRERVKMEGLESRVSVLFEDYRNLSGKFDRIVAIEMIEAVGQRYYPTFFHSLSRLLEEDGLIFLQAITIPDHRHATYARSTDWIRKRIFPGGHLPSLALLAETSSRGGEFVIEMLENIGPHYALTLNQWRKRFRDSHEREPGLPETEFRKWDYYMASCEAAFAERSLSTLQLLLTRCENRRLDARIPARIVTT